MGNHADGELADRKSRTQGGPCPSSPSPKFTLMTATVRMHLKFLLHACFVTVTLSKARRQSNNGSRASPAFVAAPKKHRLVQILNQQEKAEFYNRDAKARLRPSAGPALKTIANLLQKSGPIDLHVEGTLIK